MQQKEKKKKNQKLYFCSDNHVVLGVRLRVLKLSVIRVHAMSRRASGRVTSIVCLAVMSCWPSAVRVASWLSNDLVSQVVTRQSRTQKIAFYVPFWVAQEVPNIFTSDPKILGLSIKAIHGPNENLAIK